MELPFKRGKKPDYRARLEELDDRQEEIMLQQKVRDRERELGLRPTFKKPTWDKLMMIVIFTVCVEIVAYAEAVMWMRYDLTALYALIGVPVAMFGTFWSYSEKAKAQNTAGGITYDTAMKQLEASLGARMAENNSDTLNDESQGVDADGEGKG